MIRLKAQDDFDGWREGAKAALTSGLSPEQVHFEVEGDDAGLFSSQTGAAETLNGPPRDAGPNHAPTVPKSFLDTARQGICHSDPERFALLYRLLVRLQDDKTLMKQGADRDVHRVNALAKEVRRDAHKMTAFVRFRKTGETADGVEQFVSWFEPSHHIVRHTGSFFMRRFAGMNWSILTPMGCSHWNGKELTFSEPVPKSQAPADDALEDYWRSYYAAIFNPARLKVNAMTSEMPKKYWKNLPEADLIPGLVAKAQDRERRMRAAPATEPKERMMAHLARPGMQIFPDRDGIETLEDLRNSLKGCKACPLWKPATQAVPGRGPSDAKIMLVGEQPGDQEDLAGEPFVGPAGIVLREIMSEAGVDIAQAYVTNAVKHFKFEPRGKRRLHKNPSIGEIDHCKWWLGREIELVQPKVIVALGGSAVRALTGKTQTIKSLRGRAHELHTGQSMVVANHPSYILRIPNERAKAEARQALKDDLEMAFAMAA